MFWLTVRESSTAAHVKRPLVHIRLVVLHNSVFISVKFPDSLQKRSPGCSEVISMLGALKATALPLVDSSERSRHSPGTCTSGLGKRETMRPAVREMNVCACSHQENHLSSQCEGKGYATISFLNLRMKLLSESLTVRMRFRSTVINTHVSRVPGRFRRCRSGVQPRPRIMIDGDRGRLRFAMHRARLHRFAFDFCDSHFFALRFAVPQNRFANCDAKPDKLFLDLYL